MKTQISTALATMIIAFTLSSCDTDELVIPGLVVPLTVNEDSSLPSISVNETLLHSEAFGDPNDPMIITIHGGPGADYRSMLNLTELVNDGYYVVFFDQRGSGLSQRHDASIYTEQLALEDLQAVIDHYQSPGQKLILMGHSWGAMLATAHVNNNPESADGLILMEPGGLNWTDTEEYIGRARPLEPFGETTNDFVYQDQFITGSNHNTLDYKGGLAMAADFAAGNQVGNPGPFPFWRFGSACSTGMIKYVMDHSFDFTTELDQFDTQVLFIYSELNKAYGEAHAEKVAAPFQNVELIELPDTGHEMIYFGWGNLYPVISAYLNKLN